MFPWYAENHRQLELSKDGRRVLFTDYEIPKAFV
jgi:hypothetical protein